MSLITIVQNVCAELAIDQPTAVMSSADRQIIQLRQLAYRAGYELARAHDWSRLIKQRSFTTTGTYPEAAEPPTDFDRIADNSVLWNNSRLWTLNGPVSPQAWQRNRVINTNPVPQIWRMFGGKFDIYPNTAGETISYEYVSNAWVVTGGGSAANWTQDSDTAVFSDAIIELSLIWRWKRAKGLDFGIEFEAYRLAKEDEIGSDRAAQPVSLSLPNRGSVPDSYWPGVVTP